MMPLCLYLLFVAAAVSYSYLFSVFAACLCCAAVSPVVMLVCLFCLFTLFYYIYIFNFLLLYFNLI